MGALSWSGAVGALLVAQRTAAPGQINHAFVDPWSLVHGLVGVMMAALGFGLAPTLVLALSWEFIEHALKNIVPAVFPHPTQDTLANSVGDVLSSVLGWYLLSRVRARWRPRLSSP
jgi:hypothetical protein